VFARYIGVCGTLTPPSTLPSATPPSSPTCERWIGVCGTDEIDDVGDGDGDISDMKTGVSAPLRRTTPTPPPSIWVMNLGVCGTTAVVGVGVGIVAPPRSASPRIEFSRRSRGGNDDVDDVDSSRLNPNPPNPDDDVDDVDDIDNTDDSEPRRCTPPSPSSSLSSSTSSSSSSAALSISLEGCRLIRQLLTPSSSLYW
jgi:hypothetical protein